MKNDDEFLETSIALNLMIERDECIEDLVECIEKKAPRKQIAKLEQKLVQVHKKFVNALEGAPDRGGCELLDEALSKLASIATNRTLN